MPNIVAGLFDDREQADVAIRSLAAAGIGASDINVFNVNAPGQHNRLPLGGDKIADETAAGSETGAVTGAAIGTGVGMGLGAAAALVAGPIAIAAGAATGAFLGSLGGALNRLGENADERPPPPERPAGVLLAVHAPQPETQQRALELLVAEGARRIETADGTWRDGRWVDFDPVAPPQPADQVHPASGRGLE